MFCGSITVKGDIGWGKVGKPPMDIMPSGGPATTVPNTSKNSGSLTIPTNGEEEPCKNTFDIAVTVYGYIKVGVGVAGWKGTGEVGGWSLSKGFYWEPKGKSEFVADGEFAQEWRWCCRGRARGAWFSRRRPLRKNVCRQIQANRISSDRGRLSNERTSSLKRKS